MYPETVTVHYAADIGGRCICGCNAVMLARELDLTVRSYTYMTVAFVVEQHGRKSGHVSSMARLFVEYIQTFMWHLCLYTKTHNHTCTLCTYYSVVLLHIECDCRSICSYESFME